MINGNDVGNQPPVTCEQVQWVWFVDTLQPTPGFSAQLSTGQTVTARLVQIDDLGGFTGTAWSRTDTDTDIDAEAMFVDGTFTVAGTALGFYQDSPSETATVRFEIRTDC